MEKNTGTVAVSAVFDNPDRLLLSGSTGNIRITNENNNAIVIPQSATVKIQDKYLVYKVIDGKAKSMHVTVDNYNNGTDYIVMSGISEGDIIVADGVGLVREGMDITVNNKQ